MAKIFASWVHGNAAFLEFPHTNQFPRDLVTAPRGQAPASGPAFSDVIGWRRAWGAFFHIPPNDVNFIHIPIPTPVLVEDLRASLARAMVLFRADPVDCFLIRVEVFDGQNSIALFPPDRNEELGLTGDHTALRNENTFTVNRDAIAFGIGLTLTFRGGPNGGDVYIASAGCDFLHNI
jgi:hypothetical protein